MKAGKDAAAAVPTESVLLPQNPPVPVILAQPSPAPRVVLPCANQFLALQEVEGEGTSTVDVLPIAGSGSAEVIIQPSELVGDIPESSGAAKQNPVLNVLPNELVEGLSDPDAVFQAIISMDNGSNKKSGGGKNLGAAKKGRKSKKKW